MRFLLHALRSYWRTDFKPGLYAATLLWAGALIAFNYAIDLEDGIIDTYRGRWFWPVLYFLLYAPAYYVAVAIWTYFHQRSDVWRQPRFWAHTLAGLGIYSFSAGFYGYQDLSATLLDGRIYVFAYKCLSNLHSLLTIVGPLLVFYYVADRAQPDFYGIKPKRQGMALYALLLAIMAPVIYVASTQPDFLQNYPTYRDTGANVALNVPKWLTVLIYELCYGWDFVPTELMFRGFMVLGLSRATNGRALRSQTDQTPFAPVLPMVVWYAAIHFGRPLGETLSSLVGGYILGVLALQTRSIWGGLFIHIGIAWMMEAAAFWQTYKP